MNHHVSQKKGDQKKGGQKMVAMSANYYRHDLMDVSLNY